ncbi:glycosyltransferase [Hyunsoonleella pacifica]|uniref:Glycosyltransferase family 4 protein n=1 Tax=Hyunsoonleella pacifica TaxID=1080224 RepID=A0A4Q9FKL7_9FLAO|nr:glycosyltransferase [Hyunsoonleella pacifica]TBN13925.1 glycosyltransferase family 4 protein [Hyunsoonleella pacifica]GGD26827.1 N-acetylgalactosamine-N,N'-diacetylbacillosaminyl-diphospho-undecaprenol 4-alpha-N-acetylgalactosaminyltransferase [Hyunsoonleella pacifica]
MKIALVGYRLNRGGAERVAAILSVFFHEKGLDVHNIIVIDDIAYPYAGTVENLGKLKNKTNGVFNKAKRLIALRKYLKKHSFDFIIDFRFRIKPIQELLVAKYVYNAKTIFTVHSAKLNSYMPDQSFLTRMMYSDAFKVVAITQDMQNMIEQKHNLKNVMTIYNPINIQEVKEKASDKVSLDYEYIIGVGQYDTNVKQFDKLIYAYSKSILPSKNVALVILGEGSRKEKLLSIAEKNGVKDKVHLLGFKNNPYKYIKRARFFVLSSSHEGMPMVMLEALACGTPVVAFNCKTGPREIIIEGENGLLVEDQNIDELSNSMSLFVSDEALYDKCKSQALSTIEKFSLERIGEQWLELMGIEK